MDKETGTLTEPAPARPVLVALDFSTDSEAAFLWGAKHAALISAPLMVLHVIHDPVENPGFYNKEGESTLLPIEDIAEEKMQDFFLNVAKAQPQLKNVQLIDRKLAIGLPAGRIVEVANNENAQLIVMGTRGRTGLSNLLLGSVAKKVLQHASVPVVVVKSEPSEPED